MGTNISEEELNDIGESLSKTVVLIKAFIKKKWNDIYNGVEKQDMQ